ncbi:MAG: ROK family protein, partial [Oscillibacter sp.]
MYIGIDVGGTNLKAGLVDDAGRILATAKRPLGTFAGAEKFAEDLAALAREAARTGGVSPETVEAVGIGIPGAVSGGNVLYTCNIPLRDVPLEQLFRRKLDVPVRLENDANCAAVGEWLYGAGRGTRDFIVITLGTGVGGGFILNGRLYAGGGMVGEVGHMVICRDGVACNCGRKGCWEMYASATGLIRLTREAMDRHPESLLHTVAAGRVEGRTAFQAAEAGDETALALCRDYVDYLALGLTNLANILQPEAIALGGGVAAAPE